MSHLVITIGCEYGAKGNQIGRKIAEDLGFQFYDRNIVDAIIHEGTRRVFTIRRSYKTCDSCTENDYPQVVGQRILCDYRSFRRLYSKRT